MTNPRFPFRRLPNDLCSKVLKAMDPHEIIAHSFLSKRALSLVQSLGLSYKNAKIIVGWSRITFDFGQITVEFEWELGGNVEDLTNLDDIPFKMSLGDIKTTSLTWSHQKMNIGDWVRQICSIFQCERYEAEFHIIKIRYDIQSLRNYFPKLKGIDIKCFKIEPNEIDVQCAQNILRAFLPDVKYVILQGVPLRENLSIQHIGIANLKELIINPVRKPKFDDFLTLNVERCTFHTDQFTLRDLNRFFKLWKKGSFQKLKEFTILGETHSDLNVLLKGLQAKGAEGEAEYTIKNCYGIRANITVYNNIPASVFVSFTVSK